MSDNINVDVLQKNQMTESDYGRLVKTTNSIKIDTIKEEQKIESVEVPNSIKINTKKSHSFSTF